MKRLEKKYLVKTNEKLFYEALTNQANVSQWSGASAIMHEEAGTAFSLWGGSIVGINTKVARNQLVQQWKEKNWANYSKVSFEWKAGEEGLEVYLIHTDIPDGSFQNIKRGWDEHYMNPLITWLESNNL
ncbi:Activator of Hsp90 ATPase homolog 1-like protein [Reichenbachiella faecimaris]|uniref:Activator of Hsp90 ATPase homolog 1-like protein n=1 Tax=Reichenbachiella faecimaris TaxID=692418 RepID=A0A1W2GPU5_REIFA|nr:SRPBCC domain-containing protein [Reichenbachiella faecimaris]SMD38685.1 Activator of Hsp90 ATPase homolog 1-like protein [Reichenbachiella faecimaris]